MLARVGAAWVLLAALWSPAPAGAASEATVCEVDWIITLDVAMTPTATVGNYTSGGETGVIVCDGEINGHLVTGAGTFGQDGAYGPGPGGGADCNQGAAAGDYTATIPTDAGPQHISGPATLYWFGPAGVMADASFPGAFEVSFPTGDCRSEPAPQLHFHARGVLVAEEAGG
ncbi:MAG: hypothetical protein ACRD0C_14885 [Acidimicrobiia bacterium]